MRITNALAAMLFSILLTSGVKTTQIKIDDVGDGWKHQVDSAIRLIHEKDLNAYLMLADHCTDIEFIIGEYSTTKPPGTIAITVKDMKLNSINNIAAILVHESYHLYCWNDKLKLSPRKEEHDAYMYEYEFLCKLPDVEDWLFLNAVNQIIKNQ